MATVTGFPDDSAFERIQQQMRQMEEITTPPLRAMQDLEECIRPLQEVGRRLQQSGAMQAAMARLQEEETWAARLTAMMQDGSWMASMAQAVSQLTERLRIPEMEHLAERFRMPDFQSVVAQLDVSALAEITHQLRVTESVGTAMQDAARVLALNHPPLDVPITNWEAVEASAYEVLHGNDGDVGCGFRRNLSTAADHPNPYVPQAVTALVTWLTLLWMLWSVASWGKDILKIRSSGARPQSSAEIQEGPVAEFRELHRDAPIRDGPAGAGREVGRLFAGDLVFTLDGGDRWCEVVTLKFDEGWVYRGHLRRPE